TTGGATTGGTTTGTTQLNPIAQTLSSKPHLAAKIQKLLPAGMTLNQASAGFKNQGQFIAALHVAKNLNVPFADLKALMVGAPAGTGATGGTTTGGTTSGGTTTGGTTTGGTTGGTTTGGTATGGTTTTTTSST